MRSLSDTLSRLKHFRSVQTNTDDESHLAPFEAFGSNPGALQAKIHLPPTLRAPALVVVLHGCTQTAAADDKGSGWSTLADEHGFVVLFPQQTRANNPNLCFNWFQPGDIARGRGEALSIRQMIEAAGERYPIDRSRIFVTGLSAGGAMANVMLATYPEIFTGGAIVAGLPYAAAHTIPQAFELMRGQGIPDRRVLQNSLRTASKSDGSWPKISIWQGTEDATVNSANADAILEQWQGVIDVKAPPRVDRPARTVERSIWADADGNERMLLYRIEGMEHGTPIDAKNQLGQAGPYMLDVGFSSTHEIARSFGIAALPLKGAARSAKATVARRSDETDGKLSQDPSNGIRRTIEDGLRAAGLMR